MKILGIYFLFFWIVFNCAFIADSLNCSEPAPVANAYRIWDGGAAGSYVRYTCIFSYVHVSGNLSMICDSSTGQYLGQAPSCQLDCNTPADVIGAVRFYSMTTDNAVAEYNCNSDYEPYKNKRKRYCSKYSGRWLSYPLLCLTKLVQNSEFSTNQSSTLTIKRKTISISYGSEKAVDGTSSYSSTVNEFTPSWTMYFVGSVYEIYRVEVDLPSIYFNESSVNISIDVLNSLESFKRFHCKHDGPLIPPVFKANCSTSQSEVAYGDALEITATYKESGPLKIRDVQILGRKQGSGCDRPVLRFGKFYIYNNTNFGAKLIEYCDNSNGYYYQGGHNIRYCNRTWWNPHIKNIECEKKENLAGFKAVRHGDSPCEYVLLDETDDTCLEFQNRNQLPFVLDLKEVYEISVITVSLPASENIYTMSVKVGRFFNDTVSKLCYLLSSKYYQLLDNIKTVSFHCYGNPVGRYVTLDVDHRSPKLCEIRAFGRRFLGTLECALGYSGRDYKGKVSFTTSGKTCLRWDNVNKYSLSMFVDYSFAEAGNKCRNPGRKKMYPWCYTSKDEWEFCPIAKCYDIGTYGSFGEHYVGEIGVTKSGLQCQRWSINSPHSHHFKSSSIFPNWQVSQSFCRNPLSSQTTPWCFTTNSSVRYEACNIPSCPTDFKLVYKKISDARDMDVFKEYDQCFYWYTPTKSENMKSVDPSTLCITDTKIVLLCYKVYWKYFIITCPTSNITTTAETTRPTVTTTASSMASPSSIYTTPPSISTTPSSISTTSTLISTTPSSISTTASSISTTPSSITTTPSSILTTPSSISTTSSITITPAPDTSPSSSVVTTPSGFTNSSLLVMTTSVGIKVSNFKNQCFSHAPNEAGPSSANQFTCRCVPKINATTRIIGLQKKVETMKKILSVDKTTVSKRRRLFYSVPDYRPSSVTLGTMSIVVIAAIIGFITVPDVVHFFVWVYSAISK